MGIGHKYPKTIVKSYCPSCNNLIYLRREGTIHLSPELTKKIDDLIEKKEKKS